MHAIFRRPANFVFDRGYPFKTTFNPITGRVGYTWEAVPGIMFYSQYATAADPTVANIFILRSDGAAAAHHPREPMRRASSFCLPTSGWNSSCLPSISSARTSMFREAAPFSTLPERLHLKASKSRRQSNPFGGLKLWGNVAFVQSRFVDFSYIDGNGVFQLYSGMTPPNVPSFSRSPGRVLSLWKPRGRSKSAPRCATWAIDLTSRTTSLPWIEYTTVEPPMPLLIFRNRCSVAWVEPGLSFSR